MNSVEERLTISTQDTLLPHHPKAINNHRKASLLALLVLALLLSSSTLFFFISNHKLVNRPKSNSYEMGSAQYYCHLTPYTSLCYDTIPAVLNATALKSGPGPIFSASLQVAVDLLHKIDFTMSDIGPSLSGPRMSACRSWVNGSLSLLGESLAVSGVGSDYESLTCEEMDRIKTLNLQAVAGGGKCLSVLEEIDDDVEETGVEVVKMGVERARRSIVNSLGLFDSRDYILNDFYTPYYVYDYYDGFYDFGYGFVGWFYFGMYVFLALLYFLFWGDV
ncbi:60 kDa chaperonin [Striga asiatica]|uniref:60 kDa chaperonin n=1 Tax=Striga asiatica TaxID=4170 RepID=A0A5A7P2D7_STRAF|nr:60 kDa chaperonin [Striga asiatica]